MRAVIRHFLPRLHARASVVRIVSLGSVAAACVFSPARGQSARRPPVKLVVIHQPSARIVSDSQLAEQPTVRVMDDSARPVTGVEVTARVCLVPEPNRKARAPTAGSKQAPRCVDDTGGLVSLRGDMLVRSDSEGDVRFTNLMFSGPGGRYRIAFATLRVNPDGADTSDIMVYDAERQSNRSYISVSAIKSIAGTIPSDEFFEIRGRFRYGPRVFGMANIDVALSNRGSDTVKSSQHLLTEAAVSLNYALSTAPTGIATSATERERTLFVGVGVRVFNTLPYVGLQAGSVENAASAFHGSTFSVGVLHDLSPAVNVVQGDTLVPAQWALFSEFFIRSSTIDFFKTLNLRGGVLLPMFKKNEKLQSRITVSVPVGTLNLF